DSERGGWFISGSGLARQPIGGGDAFGQDVEAGIELRLVDVQGAQHLDDLVVGAARLDHEAPVEAAGADPRGDLAVGHLDTPHHAASLDAQRDAGARDDLAHATAQDLALALDLPLEAIVAPEQLERAGRGDERMVVAAESAVVLARRPLVEAGADEGQRKRQAEAGQRLGEGDDIGLDAGALEAEEPAGPAATGLDVVDDEKRPMASGYRLDPAQPGVARHVQPALALHRFDDDRSRLVQARGGIRELALELGGGIDVTAEVAIVGFVRDTTELDAGAGPLGGIAGERERAQAHAVEPPGERDHQAAASHLAGDLDRRLHGIRAGRPREHYPVV